MPKNKGKDRPPSPTHVFLTPFQESVEPLAENRASNCTDESIQRIRPRVQSEPSFLQRKKSAKLTKTGFGGLPIDPGLDAEPDQSLREDQNFPPSWLDASISRLGENPYNISQKCVMAKNRMTSWCRSKFKRPESTNYRESDEFIDSDIDSGNTNLGFKYSES